MKILLVLMGLLPLYGIVRWQRTGRRVKGMLLCQIIGFFMVGIVLVSVSAVNVMAAETAAETATEAAADGIGAKGAGLLAAALAVGLSSIGGGIAVAASASSALGAISENEKIFARAIVFVGMAEGVALLGMIIAFMILAKIPNL